MLYELRIYHCVPGRLPLLNNRFERFTLKLWQKHGIRPVGFWTTVIGKDNQTLYYMLQWQDLGEREKVWDTFSTDPEWLAVRAETEKDGPIIAYLENQILSPTGYSDLK